MKLGLLWISHLHATVADEILSLLSVSRTREQTHVQPREHAHPSSILDLPNSTFISLGVGVCRTFEGSFTYSEVGVDMHENNQTLCEIKCLQVADCHGYSWSTGKGGADSRCFLYSGQFDENKLVPYMDVEGERTQAECFLSAARGAEPCTLCESCGGAWGRSQGFMAVTQWSSRGPYCTGKPYTGTGKHSGDSQIEFCCLGPISVPLNLRCILDNTEHKVSEYAGVSCHTWSRGATRFSSFKSVLSSMAQDNYVAGTEADMNSFFHEHVDDCRDKMMTDFVTAVSEDAELLLQHPDPRRLAATRLGEWLAEYRQLTDDYVDAIKTKVNNLADSCLEAQLYLSNEDDEYEEDEFDNGYDTVEHEFD